jgi:hypothetical protein
MVRSASERFALIVKRCGGLGPVAKMLGCSLSFVSMMKNGKRTPGREMAVQIERLWRIRASDWPS